jgi:hypothetical protein
MQAQSCFDLLPIDCRFDAGDTAVSTSHPIGRTRAISANAQKYECQNAGDKARDTVLADSFAEDEDTCSRNEK